MFAEVVLACFSRGLLLTSSKHAFIAAGRVGVWSSEGRDDAQGRGCTCCAVQSP